MADKVFLGSVVLPDLIIENGYVLVGDGVVHPVLESVDRGHLRRRVLVVVARALHSCGCWHKEHLFRFAIRVLLRSPGWSALALGATTPTRPAHGEW